MTIILDPDTETMLRQTALREWQEPDVVAKILLTHALKADAGEYQQSVAASREALESGPGKQIEQYIAEQRVKHGYSDTWPSLSSVKEITPGVFVDSPVVPHEATSPSVDLRAHGISREQAADLRARLMPFAEDWERPEMDIYDDYDAAKSRLGFPDAVP